MIEFEASTILDILPLPLKNKNQVQAISYAVSKGMQRIKENVSMICVYSNLEQLPESILDIMAKEMRTQYYETMLSLKTKQTLLKNTLLWYLKAGTAAAVEELVQTIFGDGMVKEWYEYDGEPYHFKILTNNPAITNEQFKEFSQLLERVKRKSAVLDEILVTLTGQMNLFLGVGILESSEECHVINLMEEVNV